MTKTSIFNMCTAWPWHVDVTRNVGHHISKDIWNNINIQQTSQMNDPDTNFDHVYSKILILLIYVTLDEGHDTLLGHCNNCVKYYLDPTHKCQVTPLGQGHYQLCCILKVVYILKKEIIVNLK